MHILVARLLLTIGLLAALLGPNPAPVLGGDGARGDRQAAGDRVGGSSNDGKERQRDLAIVVLADGADPRAAARALGVEPVRVYTEVFSGFAANLPVAAAGRSSRTRGVKGIVPDVRMEGAGEVVPTGVRRIGIDIAQDANKRKPRRGAAQTATIDADVAILDSGVTRSRDLAVAGGVSCIEPGELGCSARGAADVVGHGTHVAGIVAARDNRTGVVGVAPGARIWSVRVLSRDARGNTVGWISDVIAGLDWVYQQRDTIDVVNMSLGGWAAGAGGPGDGYRLAIQRLVEGGVPVVVAAGNAGRDAEQYSPDNDSTFVPAAYPETIAVSAFADADGRPGGVGGKTCTGAEDDAFWQYSNYGAAVDIAAPGVCIRSLNRSGGTTVMSGTSMAAPHVAGVLATYVAANPGATVEQATAWLLESAAVPQNDPAAFRGDPDGVPEPALRVGG